MPLVNPFLLTSAERFIELINFKYGWLCISPVVGSPLATTNAELIDYSDKSVNNGEYDVTYRIDKLGYFGRGNPPAAMVENFPGSGKSRYFNRTMKVGKISGGYILKHYSVDDKCVYMPFEINDLDLSLVAASFFSALHLQVSETDIASAKRNVDGTILVTFSNLSQYFEGSVLLNDRMLSDALAEYKGQEPQL